jgi:hypothetical protein
LSSQRPGFVAKIMCRSHIENERLIVVGQFAQYLGGGDVLGIVILWPLQASDVTDGADGRTADLANAFGNIVRDSEDLVSGAGGRFSTWMGLPTGQWIVMSGPELIPIDRW